MTKTELKKELHKAARTLSFYNAGEGQAYERNKQREAQKAFYELLNRAEQAGIVFDKGSYLI